jgi:hypothetical protein
VLVLAGGARSVAGDARARATLMTQPNPPNGTGDAPHEAGPRWRRITAGVLLGLAILAIVLGPIMLYVRTQLLDSGAFRDRAETALASPDVQDYVADALTANLVARGGADAERAEPLVRAVVGGVVASGRFQDVFGRAVDALHDRLLDEGTAQRVVQLQDAVDQAVDAIAVVSPELAQRIDDASGEISVGQGTTGKRLAQIAHRAQQLRVLGIVLPIVAFVLIALSIVAAPERLRATRRAGWGLIAGGIVVTALVALTRRSLLGLVEEAEVRRAVGEVESAFLSSLGTWGAWVVALGVVVLATAVFLGSPLTLGEHATRAWTASTSRPARARGLVLRLLALVVIVLLAIFALDAVLTVLVAVALGLVVAYGVAELLRLLGAGTARSQTRAPAA